MKNIGNRPVTTCDIDTVAVEGLDGVYNSLAYKISEIERHFHNREKWFGLVGTPVGETHRAGHMAGGVGHSCLPRVTILGGTRADK